MDFFPSVYEHAARLIGKTPWAVSRSKDLLVQAHAAAFSLYRHAPIVIGIDIYNLEAEAYGAMVAEPDGCGIPAVSGRICGGVEDVCMLKQFNPGKAGRIPMVLEAGKQIAAIFPEADVRIPLSGPFSIAMNLAGFDRLLCDAAEYPGPTRKALLHLVEGQVVFCRAIVDSGLGVAFFESAAAPPLLSPKMFREVELPALKILLQECGKIVGHAVPCIIGGDTAPILDAILETGTGYVICPCETNQAEFIKVMSPHPEVMVRVNMSPGVLISGDDMDEAYAEADRVIAVARGREKVCIGTGALPFEAIPETVLKVREYVQTR